MVGIDKQTSDPLLSDKIQRFVEMLTPDSPAESVLRIGDIDVYN